MATPTPVQHVLFSSNTNEDGNNFQLPLPNLTLSGNCLLLSTYFQSGNTISSITGYNSGGTAVDTWSTTPITSVTDSTKGTTFEVFILPNGAGGCQYIKVVFSGGNIVKGFNPQIQEWYNLATSSPVDVVTQANPTGINSGATVASGSITTTAADDLILQFVHCNDDGGVGLAGATDNMSKLAKDSSGNFTLLQADVIAGFACQYYVQPSAGAINPEITPTITTSGSRWSSVTVALKSATSGTAPTSGACRIFGAYHCKYGANGVAGTRNIQFPTTGTTLVATSTFPYGSYNLTSVSGSVSGSWTTAVAATGSGQACYKTSATPSSDEMLSVNCSSGASGNEQVQGMLYDVLNAGAFVKSVYVTDLQSGSNGANSPTFPVILEPGVSNGLAIFACGLQVGPPSSLHSPSAGVYLSTNYTGETDSSYMDSGDGHAYMLFSTDAPQSWSFIDTTASASIEGMVLIFAVSGGTAEKTVVLTSGSTWADPGDTNGGVLNSVRVLGAGGGGAGSNAAQQPGGGGSGQYASCGPLTVTFPVSIGVGAAGGGGTNGAAGANGGASWFNGPSVSSCSIGADFGRGATNTGSSGAGGTASYGTATLLRVNGSSGGADGNAGTGGAGGAGAPGPNGPSGAIWGTGGAGGPNSTHYGGGGGGGADYGSIGGTAGSGGTPGAGGNNNAATGGGTAGTSGSNNGGAGTSGGGGGGGYGDVATAGTGGAGGNEALWTDSNTRITYGPGGGGGAGGAGTTTDAAGGAGGYGAGGGGAGGNKGSSGVHGGNGGAGLIIIKYTPAPGGGTSAIGSSESGGEVLLSGSGALASLGASPNVGAVQPTGAASIASLGASETVGVAQPAAAYATQGIGVSPAVGTAQPAGSGAVESLGSSATAAQAQIGGGSQAQALGVSTTSGVAQPEGSGALSTIACASSSGVAAISGSNPGAFGAMAVSMTANAEQPGTPIIQQIFAPGVSMSAAEVQALGSAVIAALAATASRASVTMTGGGAISACGTSASVGRAAPRGAGILEVLGAISTAATAPLSGPGAASARATAESSTSLYLSGAGALSLFGVTGASAPTRLSGAGALQASGSSYSVGTAQPYGEDQISICGSSISVATLNLLAIAPGTMSALALSATAAMAGGWAGVPVQAGTIPCYITVNQSAVSITQNQSSMEIVP